MSFGKEGKIMQKNKGSKTVAKKMVSVLNTYLHGDANAVSCIAAYQPKVPKELSKFKRNKSWKGVRRR